MRGSGTTLDPRFVRLMTALALLVALAVTVTLPAAFFLAGWRSLEARLDARATIASNTISNFAARNPDLWTFEDARIRGQLTVLLEGHPEETARVFDGVGRKIARLGPEPMPPALTVAAPIFDSGAVVGRVELTTGLRGLLLATGLCALVAALLGLGTFLVLRLMPLRLLARATARAAHMATHDPLTGLPNRALFNDRLDQALARLRRDDRALAVLCLDLDRFKEVNDTLGHGAGDKLLRQVAKRLLACLRETDTLARLGGDEFAIIQVGLAQPSAAEALATRLIAVLAQPFDLDGSRAAIGSSIGVTLRTGAASVANEIDPAGTLLQEADVALYRAKEDGRGLYRFFEAEMNDRLRERRALEQDLRLGIAEGQFRLHYQSQIHLDRRRLLGAEALLRWRHPVRGEVQPGAFIPLAEETGLIVPIGTWVLREACREAAHWPIPLRVAVNVSPVQFRHPGFVPAVAQALSDSGLDPDRLELEITEGVLLSDTNDTLATLRELQDLGVGLAMDDFGTGYSSLGYLQKFPFNKIKIDRSFINAMSAEGNATAIVSAVLGMGRALGMRVNAEGVENEDQALLLQAEGCEEAQGFLFSEPVPAEVFRALLATEMVGRQAA